MLMKDARRGDASIGHAVCIVALVKSKGKDDPGIRGPNQRPEMELPFGEMTPSCFARTRSIENLSAEPSTEIDETGTPSCDWSMLKKVAVNAPLSPFVILNMSRRPSSTFSVPCQSPSMSPAKSAVAESAKMADTQIENRFMRQTCWRGSVHQCCFKCPYLSKMRTERCERDALPTELYPQTSERGKISPPEQALRNRFVAVTRCLRKNPELSVSNLVPDILSTILRRIHPREPG
jgi:hypothetical protein